MAELITAIKNETDLNGFVKQTLDAQSALEKAMAQCVEDGKKIAEQQKTIDTLKGQTAAYETQVKELTTLVKSPDFFIKGNYRETDPGAAFQEKFGRFMWAMAESRKGGMGAKLAVKNLTDFGARKTKSKQGGDGWAEDENVYTGMEIKAGLSSSPLTGDDSVGSYYGSYTFPVQFIKDLLRIAQQSSVMMPLVNTFTMTGVTAQVPSTATELTFTKLTNQNTDKTEKTLTFGQTTITAEIYAGYIAVVEEFTEDTTVDMGRLLSTMFMESWGQKFDELCLTDSTYGAMATSGIKSYTMNESAFSGLNSEYLNQMRKLLTKQSYRNGAQYFMHTTNWDTLTSERDADGNYMFGPLANKPDMTAYSFPVKTPDSMPDSAATTQAATGFVLLGNPKYIWNGNRVGFEFRVYDQTQSNMESGQIFFRCRLRQGFKLTQPSAWCKLVTKA